jgi:CubicO group peptidase (beta-lactamase class C family)
MRAHRAERALRLPAPARQRVCRRAGMTETSFVRSDEPPGRAAVGYLDDDWLRYGDEWPTGRRPSSLKVGGIRMRG